MTIATPIVNYLLEAYIHNDDNNEIDAQNNWWNDVSGPYHPVENPGGTGDQVLDDVEFDPYSNTRF